MSWVTKSATFLCIVSFSAAMVVIGAMELRKELKVPSEKEVQRVDGLIKALRGDELFRTQGKYDEPDKKLPERRIAKYVPDYDLQKLKKLLKSFIGGISTEDEQNSTPDAPETGK